MLVHALEARRVEDVPTDKSGDSFASLKWTCADRAHVIAPLVVLGSGEVEVVRVWASVAQVGKNVKFDIPSIGIRNPWGRDAWHSACLVCRPT